MNYLTRIPEICSVSEAATVLRFSFGNAAEVALLRQLACENAGDQTCAKFWHKVKNRISKLDAETNAKTKARKT